VIHGGGRKESLYTTVDYRTERRIYRVSFSCYYRPTYLFPGLDGWMVISRACLPACRQPGEKEKCHHPDGSLFSDNHQSKKKKNRINQNLGYRPKRRCTA